MKEEMSLSLCEGRHEIPQAVDGAIFSNTLNPLDIDGMAQSVAQKLNGVKVVDLYVTGLTVALVAVINYCYANGVRLTLWHYNAADGTYYEQALDMRARCPYSEHGWFQYGC